MSPVLTSPVSWKKPRPADRPRHSSDLTPDEQANAKRALRVLRLRLGGTKKLAEALSANLATVEEALSKRGKPSAGLALRAARLAKVALEAVLDGTWPVDGACPHCGRG